MIKVGFILSVLLSFIMHPFHISITDIEYDREARSIEIAQKIFADDLERALNSISPEKIDINDVSKKKMHDQLISSYLSKHLKIELNGKNREFDFLGTQREEDAIWCYIEITGIKKLRNIRVENKILLETFDDQMNLVHIKHEDKIRSMRLTDTKTSDYFEYD